VAKAIKCVDRTGWGHASRGPATGSVESGRPGDGRFGAHVKAVLFDEGIMVLKTFQYLLIGAGFSACMVFMLALAITEPLT
jgi:hypothetical protein